MQVIDRSAMKAHMVLRNLKTRDLSEYLGISIRAMEMKAKGESGFTEREIYLLARLFGTKIFFALPCNEKRNGKEEKE